MDKHVHHAIYPISGIEPAYNVKHAHKDQSTSLINRYANNAQHKHPMQLVSNVNHVILHHTMMLIQDNAYNAQITQYLISHQEYVNVLQLLHS